MSEMVERVAVAIFLCGYHPDQHADAMEAWSEGDLSGFVSGPPFRADEYRDMARAAITAMHEPTREMLKATDSIPPVAELHKYHLQEVIYQTMIDEALK